MKMKKFLSLAASFALCFTTVFATGCQDKAAPPPVIERLELEDTNMLLTLGDSVELTPTYNELAGETMVWTSSSPSVVSVDQNGRIDARKVGTATITAEYGSKQVSCKIEVGLSDNVPVLVFDESIDDEITLLKNTAFNLDARVRFNGKLFDDGAIEYYVADESIGSVVDGKFVTKGVEGSTQISAYATWRGQTVHTKTIQVNVITENTVLLNNGMLTALELYMVNAHEGKKYSTSQTISSVYVSENATPITDYTLSIADERIATIEKTADGWTVSAQKAGSTHLLVSFGGKEFPFALTVKRPVKALDTTVDYSLSDAKYWDYDSNALLGIENMIAGLADVLSYTLNGTEYAITNGKPSFPVGENLAMTFYNDSIGYSVNVNVYDTIFDELQDFAMIYAGVEKTDVNGSYALCTDLIEPNTVLSMPEGMVANDFTGTFNGKGHVLSCSIENDDSFRFGLFGRWIKGATIKNIALNNITLNGSSYADPAGALCYEAADAYSTIENVFASVKFSGKRTNNLAFMHNAGWTTLMKNVIVYAPNVPVTDSGTYGSFARGQCAAVENCYVISPAPLYVTTSPTNFKQNLPTLYASYSAMQSAGHDYSSFSAEYWDTTTYGVPVWKSLVNEFKA